MKEILLLGILLRAFSLFSQPTIVKGRIIDAYSAEVIQGAQVSIEETKFNEMTNDKGQFLISNVDIPLGKQVLKVSKLGYNTVRILITIQKKGEINLNPILLEVDLSEVEAQIGMVSLTDQELAQDEGVSYTISGLLSSSKDAFLNAAAFDFSATFFRPRGLDNANGKLLINGIEMNKQYSGRPQWSNWGGLNDMLRNHVFSIGLKPNEFAFGDIAGTTNISLRASQYSKGGRISFATSNRSYQGRVMASYNSGPTKSGWSYSFLASRRFGNEGYQDGTPYEANSFFAAMEKRLNNSHSLNLTVFYTPNRRGRSTAITQEARDLKGITYNPNWGYVDGKVRSSSVREIEEPVIILSHYWTFGENNSLHTNIGYQFGMVGTTRIDSGGTRLMTINGEEAYVGGARNPFGNYYQRLPSYFLRSESPTPYDFQLAYRAEQEFIHDGQLDWESLYFGNTIAKNNGGNSIYAVQEDRIEDKQLSLTSIFNGRLSERSIVSASINYRNLISENFASLKDLLGGRAYLDVDFFAGDDQGNQEVIVGDIAQSDLRNRNRLVTEGDRYKYNYELSANVFSGFAQAQFSFSSLDIYGGLSGSSTKYQRTGLFENGNYPGERSFGKSEALSFTNYGIKVGATYKLTGRHLIDLNAGYITKAPIVRNSFSNARINNDVVFDLVNEKVESLDLSYMYRSPILKGRLTGFYARFKDGNDIGFYFTENIGGLGRGTSAFVQEIVTGIEKLHIGAELGIEAQVTATFKLKGATSFGKYTYNNNPKLYLTSDNFDDPVSFGDGTTKLKNYHIAGGPERAYQLGIEYRDPKFWWAGITGNYFSNAYIDVNNLARTSNFSTDFDGQPFNDYNEEQAKQLLKQEKFEDYVLINIVGGKSWRIGQYFVGFFATVNNILGQEYKTGGFEQGRKSNFRDIKEDGSYENGRIFGPRYFFGNGTTYYINAYIRF